MMIHACNVYCAPPEHCDLVLTGPIDGDLETVQYQLDNAYALTHGVRVIRVEPAPEAPGLEAFGPDDLHSLTTAPPADAMRWLVWWV